MTIVLWLMIAALALLLIWLAWTFVLVNREISKCLEIVHRIGPEAPERPQESRKPTNREQWASKWGKGA